MGTRHPRLPAMLRRPRHPARQHRRDVRRDRRVQRPARGRRQDSPRSVHGTRAAGRDGRRRPRRALQGPAPRHQRRQPDARPSSTCTRSRSPPALPGPAPCWTTPTVQQRVVDGLAWLHDAYYGDQAKGYYGNWFNWEIGISTYVSQDARPAGRRARRVPARPDRHLRRLDGRATCATARTATSTSTRASTPAPTSPTSPPTASCRAPSSATTPASPRPSPTS